LQKQGEDPQVLQVPAGEPKGCDQGASQIRQIQRQDTESAAGEEVSITMLGSSSVENDGGEEHAGEDEKKGRAESVVYLQSQEMQNDGGLGSASQMVQHDERDGKQAHPVQRRNMFRSCVPLNCADHASCLSALVHSRLDSGH
jgi:hypothetical protein